jgi:hypothetical protein
MIDRIKQNIKGNSRFIIVGLVSGFAGALSISLLGVVQAAIPDSSGTIHGCRNNTTTMLRVVDSDASQTCDSNESALNWDQNGVKGYGYVTHGSTSTSLSRDKNISNFYSVAMPSGTILSCFTLSTVPASISTAGSPDSAFVGLKDGSGWTGRNGSTCDANGSGANVAVESEGDYFVTLY